MTQIATIAMNGRARCMAATALLSLAGVANALEYRYVNIAGPGPATPDGWAEAVDINAKGQVVGNGSFGGGADQKGFIYDNGGYTMLAGPAGARDVWARSISDDGTVVGWYGASNGQRYSFIYSGGQYHDFEAPELPGGRLASISPNGRYLAGQALGSAFVYDRVTSTLSKAPELGSSVDVRGINDNGVLVGYRSGQIGVGGASFTFDGASGVQTVYDASLRLVFKDINSSGEILALGLPGSQFTTALGLPGQFRDLDMQPSMLFWASGMNENGWVVGAYVPDLDTMRVDGVVAIPVPEPATWVLLAGGLAFVGRRARQR